MGFLLLGISALHEEHVSTGIYGLSYSRSTATRCLDDDWTILWRVRDWAISVAFLGFLRVYTLREFTSFFIYSHVLGSFLSFSNLLPIHASRYYRPLIATVQRHEETCQLRICGGQTMMELDNCLFYTQQ